VTRPRHLPTPSRFTDPAWIEQTLEWATGTLLDAGVVATGHTQPHVRPWSTVLRIETRGREVFWLKANGDGTRNEPMLLETLARLDVPSTPRPLAIDRQRALTLLPDGGPTVREANGGLTPLDTMARIWTLYASTQRATDTHVGDLLAAGLDDVRPTRMPGLLADLIEVYLTLPAPFGLAADDAARLRALLPSYAEACTELAEAGIGATLQHDDLHDNNVFARGPVFFDWGDAVLGHPFGTLATSLRSVAHHHRLAPDAPELHRLADAYTEAWTDVADRVTLRRQADLAVRVGALTRSLAWRRALVGVDDEALAEHGDYPAGWLAELEADDLPLLPPLLG
jgi:hypothetical protein